MKESGRFPRFAGWQNDYGAFTCSASEKESIIIILKTKKNIIKKKPFFDKYKRLLIENGVPFEDKYLL